MQKHVTKDEFLYGKASATFDVINQINQMTEQKASEIPHLNFFSIIQQRHENQYSQKKTMYVDEFS